MSLKEAKQELGGEPQLVHYMAVPPAAFGPLTEAIGTHGLAEGSRVVYEKPFGTSMDTFTQLDRIVHETFEESQVYRIDHFLGKEATQNIHVLRFANRLFAGAWDNSHIESVQIDVPETLDVAMRASFYESTGAILDMLVTHLFQLAGEVAMEPPHCLEPECLAEARESVIGCFRPLTPSDVVVGQYEGYRDIDGRSGRLAHRDLRRRPDVGGQRSLGGSALLAAHRQVPRRQPSAGQCAVQRCRCDPPRAADRRQRARLRALR